jgi:S1-C subfamily serine protease
MQEQTTIPTMYHVNMSRLILSRSVFVVAVVLVVGFGHCTDTFSQDRAVSGLRDLQAAFRTIARKVKPAVVNVSAIQTVEARSPMSDLDPFFGITPFETFSVMISLDISCVPLEDPANLSDRAWGRDSFSILAGTS